MVALLTGLLLATGWSQSNQLVTDSVASDSAVVVPISTANPPFVSTPTPSLWGPTETGLAIGTVLGAVGLMSIDEDAQSWASTHHSMPSRSWAFGSKMIGDGYLTLPITGALWAIGEWKTQPRLIDASRNGLEAWCLTQVDVQSMKLGFHRSRPSESSSSQVWGGPGFSSQHLSFPSGHSASAWGLLPAFAMEYSDSWWIPVTAYGLAASTSLSRIHDGQHWASDVFFSAGVGILSNRVVRHWNLRRAHGIAVVPLLGPDHMGVAIVSAI